MLIRNKTCFWQGLIMLSVFALVFVFLLTPVFTGEGGKKLSGLQYADQVFNELSKGSSWFIPQVRREIAPANGQMVNLSVRATPALLPDMELLLKKTGLLSLEVVGDKISFNGDLGKVLQAVTADSALLYHNRGEELSQKYDGLPPLKISLAWWHLLEPCIRELQKQQRLPEARMVDEVVRRALEPGNNFYGIIPMRVSEQIPLLSALLAFYILYTIWYGFAIYRIFEGLGLIKTASH